MVIYGPALRMGSTVWKQTTKACGSTILNTVCPITVSPDSLLTSRTTYGSAPPMALHDGIIGRRPLLPIMPRMDCWATSSFPIASWLLPTDGSTLEGQKVLPASLLKPSTQYRHPFPGYGL